MPRVSEEAQNIARYAGVAQKPEPPAELTSEQAAYWRSICADLPPGHIRSDNTPVLIELCRHISYSVQLSEALTDIRELGLAGTDRETASRRSAFCQLTRQARSQSQLIAVLSTKLRLTNQSRDVDRNGATNAARLRARMPIGGTRPWEFTGSARDDDDDQGPPTN